MAFDIYAAVTDRIIQQMEQGCVPWTKPWSGVQNSAVSGTTGKPYSLLNQMLLNKTAPITPSTRFRNWVAQSEKENTLHSWSSGNRSR